MCEYGRVVAGSKKREKIGRACDNLSHDCRNNVKNRIWIIVKNNIMPSATTREAKTIYKAMGVRMATRTHELVEGD